MVQENKETGFHFTFTDDAEGDQFKVTRRYRKEL